MDKCDDYHIPKCMFDSKPNPRFHCSHILADSEVLGNKMLRDIGQSFTLSQLLEVYFALPERLTNGSLPLVQEHAI